MLFILYIFRFPISLNFGNFFSRVRNILDNILSIIEIQHLSCQLKQKTNVSELKKETFSEIKCVKIAF